MRSLLGGALLLTLIAAWFAPSADTDGVVLTEHSENANPRPGEATSPTASQSAEVIQRTPEARVLRIRSREQEDESDEGGAGIFASSQWTPPPSEKVAANTAPVQESTPPPPQAPPLPFHVMGVYEEGGRIAVFLQYNDQNLVARVGDTIAEQYKLEDMNSASLKFRYLPLNQLQSLDIGTMQ